MPVRGLFTKSLIHKGELIGEYRGRKVDERYTQVKKRHTQYFFAVSNLDTGEMTHVIDGGNARKSSFLRYVNSPNSHQAANAKFVQVGDAILMYAMRDLKPGCELLAWYGPHTKDIINQR
jgi:hypothetical protein